MFHPIFSCLLLCAADISAWNGDEEVDSVESLMAMTNRTATGLQLKDKPEDQSPQPCMTQGHVVVTWWWWWKR